MRKKKTFAKDPKFWEFLQSDGVGGQDGGGQRLFGETLKIHLNSSVYTQITESHRRIFGSQICSCTTGQNSSLLNIKLFRINKYWNIWWHLKKITEPEWKFILSWFSFPKNLNKYIFAGTRLDQYELFSADEAFDGTYQTKVLVDDEGNSTRFQHFNQSICSASIEWHCMALCYCIVSFCFYLRKLPLHPTWHF